MTDQPPVQAASTTAQVCADCRERYAGEHDNCPALGAHPAQSRAACPPECSEHHSFEAPCLLAIPAPPDEPAFAFVTKPLPWAQAREWLLAFDRDYAGLDPGIRDAVRTLMAAGVETFESCQGGPGHAYAEPTVRFHGGRSAGWRALTAAQEVGLPVSDLRRTWLVIDGEPVGPYWEIVFAAGVKP